MMTFLLVQLRVLAFETSEYMFYRESQNDMSPRFLFQSIYLAYCDIDASYIFLKLPKRARGSTLNPACWDYVYY
jgi:hypothetical protein